MITDWRCLIVFDEEGYDFGGPKDPQVKIGLLGLVHARWSHWFGSVISDTLPVDGYSGAVFVACKDFDSNKGKNNIF